jgi:hypothetical protein
VVEIRGETEPGRIAAVLRERIYGGIACLSTLLVLARADAHEPWLPLLDVAVATGALWAASLFADVVAHLAAHGTAPRGAELVGTLRTSGQILEAAVVPAILLVLAGLGVLRTEAALRAGIWVSVVTLGIFASLAVRRTGLPFWKRTLLVAVLVGIGALVILAKTFAH